MDIQRVIAPFMEDANIIYEREVLWSGLLQ